MWVRIVVTKTVVPNMVVAGYPARELCSVDEYMEHYQGKMFDLKARTIDELRRKLTLKLWGDAS